MNTLNNLDTFLDVAAQRFSYSDNNAIALDIIEQYKGNQYDSISSLISDIEMAHCAAGSFNDMIYTRDIERKLCDSDWIDAIDSAIEDYADNTGETPTFERVTDMVTFAVDWTSNTLASHLWYMLEQGDWHVVLEYSDTCDTKPESTLYETEHEATDAMFEAIEQRVQFVVDHSQYMVSETERDAIEETESMLVKVESAA
tara:strand:- start:526 stop:1125 length:600 start_codon:yes stop_codon:yes gene_type:complete